jgi:hypothetical protein
MHKDMAQLLEWCMLQGRRRFGGGGVFSLALISLSRVLVFMPSLENFSFVLHFVFVLS